MGQEMPEHFLQKSITRSVEVCLGKQSSYAAVVVILNDNQFIIMPYIDQLMG